MSFLARLFRRPPADETLADVLASTAPDPEPESSRADASASVPAPDRPAPVACPSCAALLDPPPVRNRRCPRCRRTIVVRRTGGRTVYLTEAAVEVFEEQRQREASLAEWTQARAAWLRLAATIGASEDRRQRIEERPLSPETVADAKALYLAAVGKATAAARRRRSWDQVATLERERAAALYQDAGSPIPPPDEIVALQAKAMVALLRSFTDLGTHAEVVGASCCPACRNDSGKVLPIAEEIRKPRLPHAGCPRGICPCEWWVGGTPPRRRRRKRTPAGPPTP